MTLDNFYVMCSNRGEWPPTIATIKATPQIDISEGLFNELRAHLKASKEAGQEHSATLDVPLDAESASTLSLGPAKIGKESEVNSVIGHSAEGKGCIGSFHTHPHYDGIQAPSGQDLTSLCAGFAQIGQSDVVSLIVGALNCLMIITKTSQFEMVKNKSEQIQTSIVELALRNKTIVKNEMISEIAQSTDGNPEEYLDPIAVDNISYTRALKRVCEVLKIALYTGQGRNLSLITQF